MENFGIVRQTALLASPEHPMTQSPGEQMDAIVAVIRRAFLGSMPSDRRAADDQSRDVVRAQIRATHLPHRQEFMIREAPFVRTHLPSLIRHFASGRDIEPTKITPVIEPVDSGTEEARLFRLATALWSIPVSRGFGRRMRFLVRDARNGKLIGIFALGDPVFNLRVRDEWVGWSADQRRSRLVSVMDGYVVGAMPPYNSLLGGKLVTSLMASSEVAERFRERYHASVGMISGKTKESELALITITSALGRSSVYNRVRLSGLIDLQRLGQTRGYGHFHVGNALFTDMRKLLQMTGHRYADGYSFGQGPNWRIRVIREALRQAGLDDELVRHGVEREVFGMPLVTNWRGYLRGDARSCLGSRIPAAEIAEAALERWVVPRASRMPGFARWRLEDTLAEFARATQLARNPVEQLTPNNMH